MQTIDLTEVGLRETNKMLHAQAADTNQTVWEITNARGAHAIACGLDAPIEVTVKGSTGYYCGGMNQQATVNIDGSAGPGTGENIMSGKIVIEGDASQYSGCHRSRRFDRGQRQCLFAMRHFNERREHRRSGQHRPHERLYGPIGQPCGLR